MVTVGAGRGVRLSRVTLVGRRRRVDLVLPSDEPVGRFLPDVLELLGGHDCWGQVCRPLPGHGDVVRAAG